MEEFLLVFRNENVKNETPLSPEQLQALMQPWQKWMDALATKSKLVSSGNRLASGGKVVNQNNVVTNGPYVELKETIGGYIIIRADSLEEATELCKGCPILSIGGNIEIRMIVPM